MNGAGSNSAAVLRNVGFSPTVVALFMLTLLLLTGPRMSRWRAIVLDIRFVGATGREPSDDDLLPSRSGTSR
jgi:hypothetical protein